MSSFDARLEQERIHSRKLVGGCLEGFSIKKVEVKSLMRILCLLGGVIILDLVCIRKGVELSTVRHHTVSNLIT